MVVSLVLSRLDYGNATLAGTQMVSRAITIIIIIPLNLLRHLQSVLSAAAKVISGLPRWAQIVTTLANLLWFHRTHVV